MAEIQFPSGFKITSNDSIDTRLVLSKEQMLVAEYDFAMPDKYFCLCTNDGRLYLFDINNESIDDFSGGKIGRFRLADSHLQEELNNQVAALKDRDSELNGLITREQTRAKREENSLNTRLGEEVTRATNEDARLNQAILDEASARSSAYSTLSTKLNNEITNRTNAVNTEKTQRTAADTALRNDLNKEISDRETAISGVNTALSNEIDRATLVEGNLSTAISSEVTRAKGIENGLRTDLAQEIYNREDAVNEVASNLRTAKSELTTNINTVDGKLTSAKTELSDAIDTERQRAVARENAIASTVSTEATNRRNADIELQRQIDAIEGRSDVVDIVPCYDYNETTITPKPDADLVHYNTSELSDNDIVKVLADESRDNTVSFYRWIKDASRFVYVGSLAPTYTKEEINTKLDAKQNTLRSGINLKTINNQSLLAAGDISITEGALLTTGEVLDEGNYITGQIYYCTENSDSFVAGETYVATGANSIVKLNSTVISTAPAIKTFSVSPTSTEYGDAKVVTYNYSLKKYQSITNLALDGTVIEAHPAAASGSGSAPYAFDNHTFTLSGIGVTSKSASLTALYRQFYGVVSGETIVDVLANLKNVKTDEVNLKTFLQNSVPSSVSLELGGMPVYVYFIVKDNLSINSITSAGFEVPFEQVGTTYNFTNSYNAAYSVKVYRTSNKVFGSVTFKLN